MGWGILHSMSKHNENTGNEIRTKYKLMYIRQEAVIHHIGPQLRLSHRSVEPHKT